MKRYCFVLLALLAMPQVAFSQTSSQPQGRSGAQVPGLTLQAPLDQTGTGVVRDAFGRPCLDIEAAARPEVVNPQMLDHVVSIKNNCPRVIKVKVCYFGSNQCKDVELQAYKRVDTILGAMRGINFFRYSIVQK